MTTATTHPPEKRKQQLHIEVGYIPEGMDEKQVFLRQMLAAGLYKKGEISMKEACDLAIVSRREFEEEVLPTFGFAMMDEDAFDDEMNAAKNI